MAKEPRNYNRVNCVRKKETLQDKSRRRQMNKRPLRNSTNANKLYSEGGRLFHFTMETHEELLQEILNINLLSNYSTFQDKLIEYLKKTTIYCAKYIDEIFKNPKYKEDLKYYTCASRDRIKKVYKLVTEYIKGDFEDFNKRVFNINLKRLLTSQSQLSNTEIANMRDNDAKAQIQQYNSDLDSKKRKKEQKREQKKEEEKEEEKKEERREQNPETITDFLKDKPTILTSSKVLTYIDVNELKNITTIYSNDSNQFYKLITYLNINKIENINTIILENFDLNNVTDLLNVENIKKVETLVLKHQVRVGKIRKCIDISAIISLLKVIKEKTILTHFEFSNFYIDLGGDSDNTSISEFFSLLSSILERESFKRFDFINNTFKNQKALDYFNDLTKKLNESYSDKEKIKFIVEWLYRFKNINPYTDKYIYVEWLKWSYEGAHEEVENINNGNQYIYSKKYSEFNKLLDDNKKLNEWLKLLIRTNEEKIVKKGHLHLEEYDDIDVRLYIIISFLIKQFNKQDTNPNLEKSYDELINFIINYIFKYLYEDNNIKSIIQSFVTKKSDYSPTEGNISSKYNKIIIDYIASPYITNQGKNTIISLLENSIQENSIQGGCKINRKVVLKAPKNAPKVVLKAPKKAPEVVLKAPKNAPKVVLKEPNTYAVIKQKIRVNK